MHDDVAVVCESVVWQEVRCYEQICCFVCRRYEVWILWGANMVVWWEAGLWAEDLGGNGLDAGECSGGQACKRELWVDRPNDNGNSLKGVSTMQMMGWMYKVLPLSWST
jgi:hypothetical protein